MTELGLLARIEAKPEYADEVEALLRDALQFALEEDDTVAWFAFRLSDTTFGVFDTFDDEQGRQDHLQGKIAAALMEVAETMLTEAPEIRPLDVLAAKLP
jgi:quinol monooxygenase YgiN